GLCPYLLNPQLRVPPALAAAAVDPSIVSRWVVANVDRVIGMVHAFHAPVARDGYLTVRSAAVTPVWVLGLAVLGACTGVRRGLFLGCGFLSGLLCAWLSPGGMPSAFDMVAAFPCVALAAACALDLPRWPLLRGMIAVAALSIAGWQSIRWYFSADFWPAESRSVFAADTTALVEAIPRPPRGPLMITKGVDQFFAPQALVAPQFAHVSADNWIPADRTATFYAFDGSAAALRPFYENLVC